MKAETVERSKLVYNSDRGELYMSDEKINQASHDDLRVSTGVSTPKPVSYTHLTLPTSDLV